MSRHPRFEPTPTEDLSATEVARRERHGPGRRHQDLPPELIEASRRAGARASDGDEDGTDLPGREQLLPEGMHEALPGRLHGEDILFVRYGPRRAQRPDR